MILELKLRGEIGQGLGISVDAVREKIAAAAGTFDAISLDISSNGGDLDQAVSLFTMFRSMPFPIAATATGDVFSGALLVFMSAGLRRAKSNAQFLIHPTSRGREQLPERVTAEVLQKQAHELAEIDERVVDLFVDRTGGSPAAREFFEREKATEDTLGVAAIEYGVVHEMEGLAPPCDPAWPENMRRIEKETGCIFPRWMTTAAYMEACRVSAFFGDKKTERADVVPPGAREEKGDIITFDALPSAPPHLTVIAS